MARRGRDVILLDYDPGQVRVVILLHKILFMLYQKRVFQAACPGRWVLDRIAAVAMS